MRLTRYVTASDSSEPVQYQASWLLPFANSFATPQPPSHDKFDGNILTKLDDDAIYTSQQKAGPYLAVHAADVHKVESIILPAPDGCLRLIDYLANVEKEITLEEGHRKHDVQAVQDYAFSQEARRRLKTKLLAKMCIHKMAKKAKRAKDYLAQAMVSVQKKFADATALQNKRNKANIQRTANFRTTILRNKNFAAKQLRVSAQPKVMAALKSAMNERICQTDNVVSKNAAQIKDNANEARKQLDKTVASFDKKAANAKAEAAKERSELEINLQNQVKSVTQWANKKLKAVVATTAAKFNRVSEKMAADHEHADNALKTATTTMTAALNADTALNEKNFAKTVKDVQLAKDEAKEQVQAAQVQFKPKIRAQMNRRVTPTNARITQLSGVVDRSKVALPINKNHADRNSNTLYILTSSVKDQEIRLMADLGVASSMHINHRVKQIRVNRRTNAEIQLISRGG